MTTSGTYTFTYNRDQIIRRAARIVNAIAQGETPNAQVNQDFSDALNSMVKMWVATGLHLWAEQEAILFLQPNQVQYALGSSSTDNATNAWSQTTVISGAGNTLIVNSVSGIANGNFIGIQLTSGQVYWTAVNGAPVGTMVTLAAPFVTAPNPGALVFSYATKMQRPLRVIAGRRLNWPSAIETPLDPPLSRFDYFNYPNKFSPGTPTQFFYDPQLVLGQIYIWPAPTTANDSVRMTTMRELQDFVNPGDTPDFPQEWIEPLIWNLANIMVPEFGVGGEQAQRIEKMAASTLDLAMGFDREPESIYVGVSIDHR